MLKKFCDRCAAEMPIEQTMDERELILRRLNDKPFDLCPVCQGELKTWFDKQKKIMLIPKGNEVLQFVTRCNDCQFYSPKNYACRELKINVHPEFWCKFGQKDSDDSASIGGADDKRDRDTER